MTMTAGETELLDMTEFEFDSEVPCDYQNCTRPALGYLVCGDCHISREAICREHRRECDIVATINPMFTIIFNASCDHLPIYIDCTFEPLT